jgi:chorismate-pyruvate lyase
MKHSIEVEDAVGLKEALEKFIKENPEVDEFKVLDSENEDYSVNEVILKSDGIYLVFSD